MAKAKIIKLQKILPMAAAVKDAQLIDSPSR
jgi:hypothetical protein